MKHKTFSEYIEWTFNIYASYLNVRGQKLALQNKVAIVTGASRGIGKAIAVGLAKEGTSVVVAARSETDQDRVPGNIHSTASEIRTGGGQGLAVACNVRDEESIYSMVQKTLDTFGKIDILVNNAGVGSYRTIHESSIKEWDLVMDINLRAPFICCKAVIPSMMEQGRGSIINISSHAATHIFSSTTETDEQADIALLGQAYGSAKAGLERFSWGLATELGHHNIAVNILKPLRPVLTEGFVTQRPDADFSNWVSPEYMVKAAIFLANQTGQSMSGATVTDEELVRRLHL